MIAAEKTFGRGNSVFEAEHEVPLVCQSRRSAVVQRKAHIQAVQVADWLLKQDRVEFALSPVDGAISLRARDGDDERPT